MQVKKFEARNMKEALQMIKAQLGPDAVILATKDRSHSLAFGGGRYVEVTAAISDDTYRKKMLAEAKLTKDRLKEFQQRPARAQRDFINKALEKAPARGTEFTRVPYITIQDDEGPQRELDVGGSAFERIRSAVASAAEASREIEPPPRVAPPRPSTREKDQEIRALQGEIVELKKIIQSFQRVPQNFITMHPGAEHGLPFELSPMFEKLTGVGISVENAVEILKRAQDHIPGYQLKKKSLIDAWVAKYILDSIRITEARNVSRYQVFVGPSGQGKTTSLVKFASHMVIAEKKKIAIVTSDLRKVGAIEQLRIFANILNVPLIEVRKGSDWDFLEKRMDQFHHILMDTPGYELRTLSEAEEIRSLLPSERGGRTIHYVQSVQASDRVAEEATRRYLKVGFDDVIFTGIDQSANHGLIYNWQKEFKVPVHSFGTGPQIPEDFEPATKERVVDLIFKLTKLKR